MIYRLLLAAVHLVDHLPLAGSINHGLGAILGLSSVKYYKDGKDVAGTLTVDPDAEIIDFQFGDMTAEDLAGMKQVKVNVDYEGKH